MPDAPDQFAQDAIDRLLKTLSVAERLEGLSDEQKLNGLSVEQRIQGLSLDEIVAALSPEMRKALLERFEELDAAPDLVVEQSKPSNRE